MRSAFLHTTVGMWVCPMIAAWQPVHSACSLIVPLPFVRVTASTFVCHGRFGRAQSRGMMHLACFATNSVTTSATDAGMIMGC